MATIKSFTSLEQSKVLAKILPIESVDMFWYRDAVTTEANPRIMNSMQVPELQSMYYSPCWSLAALLNYLREVDYFPEINADEFEVTMSITYFNDHEARHLTPVRNITVEAESFIDACVAMIEKLNEQNLL